MKKWAIKLTTKIRVKIELNSLLNLSIRLIVMGVKYFVVFFAYSILDNKEFIDFTIIIAFLNFSILVIGLDVYQITQRMHIDSNAKESSSLFFSELSTGLFLTFFLLAATLLINIDIIYGFRRVIIITFFDFFLLTVSRLLLVKKTFISSTIINSVRVIPHLLLIFIFCSLDKSKINLSFVLDLWLYTILLASVIVFILLKENTFLLTLPRLRHIFTLLSAKSFLYWFCSVSTYFLLFIDKKVLIALNMGEHLLSTYSFFFSLYSFLPALVDAFIITPNFKLILKEGNKSNIDRDYKELFSKTARIIIFSVLGSMPIVFLLQRFNPALQDGFWLLLIPLFSFTFLALSYVPSTFLYARHMDQDFFKIHLLQFLLFIAVFLSAYVFWNYLLFGLGYIAIYIYLLYAKHNKILKTIA